ncbi:MAG: hypothetical protein A2Y95_03225 [Deltaproteobacteria bacterium RBG_13_65_10]|nr:MAG: hypothetical protein A2Y95_03225 [Deltaproteobacteria bacterium RBG_13_65_10]
MRHRPTTNRVIAFALVPLVVAALTTGGCTGTTIVAVTPPNAVVTVNGARLQGNSFDYGRWIGNEYRLNASAPGHMPHEQVVDVHLGERGGLVALYSLITIIGAPFAVCAFWNGQIDEVMYISLQPQGGAEQGTPPDAQSDARP